MQIKIGSLSFELEIPGVDSDRIMDLSLRELTTSVLMIRPSQGEMDLPDLDVTPKLKPPARAPRSPNALEEVALLKSSEFSNFTIAMISNKTLEIPRKVRGESILNRWDEISTAANNWFTRKLSAEDIWAVFIAPIAVTKLRERFVVLGLNKANQMKFLHMSEKGPVHLYKELKAKGLKMEKVKFGMISIHAGTMEDFLEYFPNAKVGRDWMEFVDMADDEDEKAAYKEAMINPDEKQVRMIIKGLGGPKELLTYYQFDRKLWRALRTCTPIGRVEKDLKTHLRGKSAETSHQVNLLTLWSLLRLQYHWNKVPVDSDVLNNLKYIKANNELEG